jgi:hypothetical protein
MSRVLLSLLLTSTAHLTSLAAERPALTPPPASPLTLPTAPKSAVEREKAIELPPMIISETSKAPPWLYVSVGDTEYLSRCTTATTHAFVTSQLEIQRMLQVFVPADLLATSAVSSVSIVVPFDPATASGDAVSREMLRQEKQSAQAANKQNPGKRKGQPMPERFRFLPNLRLDDRDMRAVFTYINERDFRRENLVAAPEFVHARLVARTPNLPAWLVEGISRLYPEGSFRIDPITLRPVQWLSAADTAGLVRDPESRRVMIPVSELFVADALSTPDNQHPTRVAVWRAQAALFVRWALDPAHAPAAESLWAFARQTSQEPVTEATFVACFGFGYADLQDRLSDYLPVAVKQPTRILPGKLAPLPRFEIKPATPAQIARLRGEWERLEIPFVRRQHPEFLERYIEQARTTLRRAVGRGDRDPHLFAALGLCELDAGDPTAARPYLEQAAAENVVRPRLYYEIARLRWLDLSRDVPEGTGFTAAELEPILTPLRIAASQSPALPEVYMLMADVWLRCRERVRASDLPTLVAATPLFRRIPGVSYRVALLHVREGQRAEAAELLTIGIEFATEPAIRAQLQQLLAAITPPPNSGTNKPVQPSPGAQLQ